MKQEKKDKWKSEKGSITLFVILAGLFLIAVIFSLFMVSQNRKQAQEKEIQTITRQYQTNGTDMNDLYEKTIENDQNNRNNTNSIKNTSSTNQSLE